MSKKMTFNQLSDEKRKALDSALLNIEKQHGKNTIQKLSADPDITYPHNSTGILPLDVALGIGGFPKGRIIEIYGPESSGKTTITLTTIAEAQKKGGVCAFVDAEHALDPSYAQKLGVDIDELLVSQPDNGEQALEVTEALIRSNALDVIVIDSVAALVPKAEIEGDMGQSHVGLSARLMSQAMRKLTGAIQKSNTVVIFINQIRMKIGVMFGSPETTTGGNALKFYASVRLDVRKRDTLTQGEVAIGNTVEVKVAKNKMAPPFTKCKFDLIYEIGYSEESSLVEVGTERGIIKKAGTWYSYGETRLGQGKENARQFLLANPELTQEIKNKVLDTLKPKSNRVVVDPEVSNDNEDAVQEEVVGGEEE